MNRNDRKLHDLGQRIWLDTINRELLENGTPARYMAEFSVTGMTSNPTRFEHAVSAGNLYDDAIRASAALWCQTGASSLCSHCKI